ncbi:Alpha/Beta hydrolase protein [Syncephalis fuscata]|nr:Alpha/Beta hydrolase protein [Syncephalis fuscata]
MFYRHILLVLLGLSTFSHAVPSNIAAPVQDAHDNVNTPTQSTAPLGSSLSEPMVQTSPLYSKTTTSLPSYVIEEVRTLAQFASVSGCDPTGWACGPQCQGRTAGTRYIASFYDPATSAYVYIAVNDLYRRIIVSFRNTVNLASVLQDLRIHQISVGWLNNPKVRVHTGFLTCYNVLRDNVNRVVSDIVRTYPQYTLTFLGHSLGGGIATLAALDASFTMPHMEQQLVTFGAPRVGNPEFAKLANQQLYRPANERTGGFLPTSVRVVNTNDVVHQLPPLWLGYQHHGAEVWVPTNNNDFAVLCHPSADKENFSCANSILISFFQFDRHSIFLGVTVGYNRMCVAPSPTFSVLQPQKEVKTLNAAINTITALRNPVDMAQVM